MTAKPTPEEHLEVITRIRFMNLYGFGIFIMGCITFCLFVYFLFADKHISSGLSGIFTVIGWPIVVRYLFRSPSKK
jgi:hypothetical protein